MINAVPHESKKQRQNDKARKGASGPCLWINAQITAKSKAGASLGDLLATIAQHLPQMNLVNLATAIHRLGKLVGQHPKAQTQLKQSQVFADLMREITQALVRSTPKAIQPQSLSNILWALASVRQSSACIVYIVCDRALPNIDRFKAFELSMMLWAITKLASFDTDIQVTQEPISVVFEEASKFVIDRASMIEFRCLSMIVWAYATVKMPKYDLFTRVATQMRLTAHTATCQEMGNTAWAFGSFGLIEVELFGLLAQHGLSQMEQLKPQELSNMLWGFASSGFFHEAFYQKAAVAATTKELSTQHLANILWAFTQVRPQHALTMHTVMSFLPSCYLRMSDFKSQELASVALSVAKVFSTSSQHGHGGQRQQLPEQVTRFFEAIPRKVPYPMSSFSTQSLTNMIGACASVGICDERSLVPALGQEAIRRAHVLQPPELLRLFQVFLATSPHGSSSNVAGMLAMMLAGRLETLRSRDMRSLSGTCIDYFGYKNGHELNREELRRCCIQVAQQVASTNESPTGKAQTGFVDLHLDNIAYSSEQSTAQPGDSQHSDSCASSYCDSFSASLSTMEGARQNAKNQIRQSFFTSPQEEPAMQYEPAPCFHEFPSNFQNAAAPSHFTLDLSSALLSRAAPETVPPPMPKAPRMVSNESWLLGIIQAVENQNVAATSTEQAPRAHANLRESHWEDRHGAHSGGNVLNNCPVGPQLQTPPARNYQRQNSQFNHLDDFSRQSPLNHMDAPRMFENCWAIQRCQQHMDSQMRGQGSSSTCPVERQALPPGPVQAYPAPVPPNTDSPGYSLPADCEDLCGYSTDDGF